MSILPDSVQPMPAEAHPSKAGNPAKTGTIWQFVIAYGADRELIFL